MENSRLTWRKSSYSGNAGDKGDCVEVAGMPEIAAVRDSKNPTGDVLTFPADAWTGFLQANQTG
ncbi:DUF397 domain-containing protein [Kibdelosporangium banguiense]|nr:DUF397 domain-containing protein [Kibdelosporangium banguiense]